jgi:ribosome-associated toxin RatA of RatAB toxin-antitoxin module
MAAPEQAGWPMSRCPLGAASAVLVGVILLLASPAAAEWEQLFQKLGVLVERRTASGSSVSDFRATTTSPLEPSAIFSTLWGHREYPVFIPHLKRLDILSDNGDERITYEQIAMPLVRDRDYTMRIRRYVDLKAHRYAITFTSANEAGPPADSHHVRVNSVQGSWTVEPGSEGKGSIIRYDVRGEPGGAIPAWLASLAQQEAIVDLVRAVLARTQEIGRRH